MTSCESATIPDAPSALPLEERKLLFGEGREARSAGLSLPMGAAPGLYPERAGAGISGSLGWGQIGYIGDLS